MESRPFFFDSFAHGNVSMSLKAFVLPNADEAVLGVHCVSEGPTHYLFERALHGQVVRNFLLSPQQRELLVSDTLSCLDSFDDTAAALFWTDLISRRCMEGALHCLLWSPGLRHWRWRGILFSVEFYIRPRHRFHLSNYQMIDDVLIVSNSDSEEECSVRVEEPTRVKYRGGGMFREKECSICLEEFEESKGEDLGIMPCFHSFHYGCLSKWLATKHSCPLCRHELDTAVSD